MPKRKKPRRLNSESLEARQLLTTSPFADAPVIIQTDLDKVIYTEGADISGDGIDDVLGAGPNVLYYVSNGDGTFAETQELTSDGVGYGMTLARDIDGDSDLDIIASSSAKGIVVIKNNGDGTFGEEDLISDFGGTTRLSTADMDGDGDLDLVSGSYSGKRLAWHENNGDGTFMPEVVINDDVDGMYSVATADLNGDGTPEIVTAEFGDDNSVGLYFVTEEGFNRTTISNDLESPLAVTIADLDGDGDQDVVAAAYSGNEIVWYENDGAANFTTDETKQVTDDVGGPFRVRAADWDNDSDLDLISTSSGDDKVAFHENLGGGIFAEQIVLFENWSSPTAGSPADIDGDGDQDLLVASYSDDTLLWLRNDTPPKITTPIWNDPVVIQTDLDKVIYTEGADISGDGIDDVLGAGPNVLYYVSNRDGTFAEAQELTSDGVGYGMTLGRDVDGDNDLDIIASSSAKGIVVIKNNGDGTFGEEDLISDFGGTTRLSTADMDGDGDLDLVSGSYSGKRLAWHENNGDGTFMPEVVINDDVDGMYSVATADLNGDGTPEIVTAEFGDDNSVGLYFVTEEGFNRTTISNNLESPLAVTIADLDGDGDQDVVAAAYSGNEIVWYENDGAANFTTDETKQVTDNVGGPFRVRAADWDNDSDLDLISTSSGDDKVAFHENLGGGIFAEQIVLFENWSSPTAGSPADIDGDGDEDLLVASYADDTLLWVKNDTVRDDTRFEPPSIISEDLSAVFIVDAVDLNGDGSRDLIAGLIGTNQVAWAPNDGSGEFGEVQILDTQAGAPLFAGAADLDGDGDNDVITTSSFGADEISWYENLGDGNFGDQQIIAGELAEPRWLDAADLDGDGDLDLLGSTHDDSRYFWYENRLNEETSDFVLAQVIDDGEGEGANKIFALDMDGDGDLDAFTASATPSGARPFSWYENDGNGNFTNPTVIAESTVSKWYARPADMDGDGDIDVVASSFIAPLIWFENLGDGTFSEEQVISTGPAGSYGLDVADLDGDGDNDIVSGSYADNEVAWYENNGDGTFSGQQVVSRIQSGLFSVVTADIDGDGDEDILAGSYYDNTAAWYENNPESDAAQELPPVIDRYVTTEHLDLAFNFIAGEWQATADVDFESGSEFIPSDEIVIFALPPSETTRQEGDQWDFIGVEAGDPVWILPQNRNPEIAYPGFAVDRTDNGTFARYFENDPRIDAERDWVKIELVDVRGPEGAHFGTYSTLERQVGELVGVWMATSDGIAPDDAFWQREGGHSHANFFFTEPGVYEVDLKASGFIDVNDNRLFDPGLDVFTESDVSTFYFAVDTPNAAPTIIAPTTIDGDAGASVPMVGGNAIQITDEELSSADYTVTLQAVGGTLSINAGDAQLTSGDGVDDTVIALFGQLPAVNAALESLQFNIGDDADAAGLQVNVNDGGYFHPDVDGDGVSDNAMSASASIGAPIAPSPRSVGDLDDDGAVRFTDFLILANSFGSDVDPLTDGDIDGDGRVSFADFLILSENFGRTVDEIFAQA